MMKNIEIFLKNEDFLQKENAELRKILQIIDTERINYKAESE
jgi:hypothetical protein